MPAHVRCPALTGTVGRRVARLTFMRAPQHASCWNLVQRTIHEDSVGVSVFAGWCVMGFRLFLFLLCLWRCLLFLRHVGLLRVHSLLRVRNGHVQRHANRLQVGRRRRRVIVGRPIVRAVVLHRVEGGGPGVVPMAEQNERDEDAFSSHVLMDEGCHKTVWCVVGVISRSMAICAIWKVKKKQNGHTKCHTIACIQYAKWDERPCIKKISTKLPRHSVPVMH